MTAAGPDDGDEIAPGADAGVVEFLRQAGVPDDEIAAAARAGLAPLLAVSKFAFVDEQIHTISDTATEIGVSPERLEQMWLAVGFPKPRPGEPVFADADVELLRDLRDLIGPEQRDADVVLNTTRVMGASLSRIAESQADLIARQGPLNEVDGGLLIIGDLFARLMERTWRRHLAGAATARLEQPCGHNERATCVGFADLVGFTSMSQQLEPHALAEVVERFEEVAFATIETHGGSVVKMIGDEVMFEVTDPVEAAQCALDLSASYHEADDLSDVRVGLAHGEVIERDGDLYGPTVNLASRMTGIAFAGSVVVDEAMRDLLADDERFALRPMLPRRLKHIGRVALWVLRDANDVPKDLRELRRARRRARLERDR